MKNPQKEDGEILAIISGAITLILLLVWIFLTWNLYSGKVTKLEEENGRQWDYYRTLSGIIDEQNKIIADATENIDTLHQRTYTTLDNLELANQSKIYDLEITICRIDSEADEIRKRNVVMKNVIAINPSVERTATVVDTGLWYGSSVKIPTIMENEEEYACGLSIISVR